jgi:hypothetical protein
LGFNGGPGRSGGVALTTPGDISLLGVLEFLLTSIAEDRAVRIGYSGLNALDTTPRTRLDDIHGYTLGHSPGWRMRGRNVYDRRH